MIICYKNVFRNEKSGSKKLAALPDEAQRRCYFCQPLQDPYFLEILRTINSFYHYVPGHVLPGRTQFFSFRIILEAGKWNFLVARLVKFQFVLIKDQGDFPVTIGHI